MNIAKSSMKIFVAKLLSAIISFGAIALFSRKLGPSVMGVFFLFRMLVGVVSVPADFGIRSAVEKRLSEGESFGTILSTAVLLKALLLSLFVMVIILLQDPINNYIGADLSIYLAAALVLQGYARLITHSLRGQMRVGETAILEITRRFVWAAVAIILIWNGLGVYGLVIGDLAAFFVVGLIGVYKLEPILERPSLASAHSLVDYSKFDFISTAGGYLYGWTDTAVIGLLLTQADVGVYEIAWQLTAIVMIGSNSIAAAIFPKMSEWDTEDAAERIEDLIPNALTPTLLLTVPAFFGVLLFPEKILGLIYGSQYTAAWTVLIVLMGGKVFRGVHRILGQSLRAINQPRLSAHATIMSSVANIVLNLIFIWRFGIIGAAVATVIASLFNAILHYSYLSRFVSVKIPYRDILWSFAASLGMCIALSIILHYENLNSISNLIAIVFFGLLVYSSIIFLNNTIRRRIQSAGIW